MKNSSYLPAYEEALAYKIQTPGNYPEESIHHSEHGESLKSRIGTKNWEQRKRVGYLPFTDHASQPE
jgi:hypothetical protein